MVCWMVLPILRQKRAVKIYLSMTIWIINQRKYLIFYFRLAVSALDALEALEEERVGGDFFWWRYLLVRRRKSP